MGSNTNSNGKKDFFGRGVKERFPHYPYSVIIPRCGPGPPCASNRTKKKKTSWESPIVKANQKHPPENEITEVHCRDIRPHHNRSSLSTDPSPSSRRTNDHNRCQPTSSNKTSPCQHQQPHTTHMNVNYTNQLCRRIAEIVAREIPQIEDKFVEEIQLKCKRYWDCLIKHNVYLDEEAVFQELTEKIREWVENNSLHEVLTDSQASDEHDNNSVEFVESEEDLEKLYGTAEKFSNTVFDSQQFFDDDE